MPENTDMVTCADGELRPREECVQCYNGEWHLRDECNRLHDGEYAHHDDEAVVELRLGGFATMDEASEVDGCWYLTRDVRECCTCQDYVLRSETYSSPGNEPMCGSCYEEHVRSCDSCGEEMWDDDAHYDEDSGESYCESCWSDRPRLISDYSDRSANRMRSESHDKVLYGIELEVEAASGDDNAGAEFVRRFLPENYCVLKHDGSLGPGGFEIVTRPDSVAVHTKQWHRMLMASPSEHLKSWTTGRCGMHVHVSRAPLSQLQIGKMLVFLNAPENDALVVKIAGRRNSSWAKIEKKKLTDVRHSPDRYSALNLTNSRTIEFRIFKGTLNYIAFLKNIEFCKALVDFCAPSSRGIAEATSGKAFLEWVSHKDYPNLYQWLVNRGLIADRRPKKRGDAA